MVTFFYVVQIISALLLIVLVLLHSPKGDGIASIGSASQLFSSQKSAEKGLNKVTYIVGGIFILTTLLLGFGIIRQIINQTKMKGFLTFHFFMLKRSKNLTNLTIFFSLSGEIQSTKIENIPARLAHKISVKGLSPTKAQLDGLTLKSLQTCKSAFTSGFFAPPTTGKIT